MCSRIFLTSLVVLLAFLTISNGKFLNFRYLTMLTCLYLSFILKKTTFFCNHLLLSPNRNEHEEPRGGTALPLHPKREPPHRSPHRQGGADPPQLPLWQDGDHVRRGSSFRSHLVLFFLKLSSNWLLICSSWRCSATLKKTGQEVCLDPEAAWVIKVIDKIMSR